MLRDSLCCGCFRKLYSCGRDFKGLRAQYPLNVSTWHLQPVKTPSHSNFSKSKSNSSMLRDSLCFGCLHMFYFCRRAFTAFEGSVSTERVDVVFLSHQDSISSERFKIQIKQPHAAGIIMLGLLLKNILLWTYFQRF